MQTFSALIDAYGYLAVFVGTFLEGETVLAMAGFAAQRGYLDLPTVIAVAFAGGFAGDQFLFFLGRRHGSKIMQRFPTVAQRIAGVDALLSRYHAPLIFGIRFMYGLRIVGPIAFGMGRVAPGKFFIFNLLGAIVWATLVAGAGFLFGHALELLLQDIRNFELLGLALIALVSVLLWLAWRVRRK